MGWKCCVPECRSGYRDTKENPNNDNKYVGEIKISFHTFPADPDLKNVWIKNIERPDWEPTANARVCSLHFKESDFQDCRKDKALKWRKDATSKLKMKLLIPDVAPSLFSSDEIEIEMNRKILALQNKSEPNPNDFANGDDCQETLENDPLNDSSPMEAEDLPLSSFKIKVHFLVFYNTLSFSTLAKLRKNYKAFCPLCGILNSFNDISFHVRNARPKTSKEIYKVTRVGSVLLKHGHFLTNYELLS